MGKTKHTPGPWTVVPRDEDAEPWDCVDIMAGKYNVAAAIYDCSFYDDEYCDDDLYLPVVDANARLIAAAPDLLEALKEMLFKAEYGNGLEAHYKANDRARAAIAKAEGNK